MHQFILYVTSFSCNLVVFFNISLSPHVFIGFGCIAMCICCILCNLQSNTMCIVLYWYIESCRISSLKWRKGLLCTYLTYDSEQDSVLEGRPFNKEHREPDCDDIDINIMMKRIMLMVLILISIL